MRRALILRSKALGKAQVFARLMKQLKSMQGNTSFFPFYCVGNHSFAMTDHEYPVFFGFDF
jgi:hypothetical protein